MTDFDESKHPRAAAGTFTAKEHDAPTGVLAEAPSQAVRDSTDRERHNAAVEAYYRQGDREISDASAATIARDMLTLPALSDPAEFPRTTSIALGMDFPHDDPAAVDELHAELNKLGPYAGHGSVQTRKIGHSALGTWAMNGGDNTL